MSMGQSFDEIYESFCNVLNGEYRTEPDRTEAVIQATADAVKAILEKLRYTDAR